MKSRHNQKSRRPTQVRTLGRSYTVQDHVRLGPRSYLLLDRISCAGRERFLGYDPHAKSPRSVLFLPRVADSRRRVETVRRATEGNISIPRILDIGNSDGKLVLVLEWIPGPTLSDFLSHASPGNRFSAYEAFRLFRGLAHGLSRLHRRRQVMHGDIKPDNLVVAPHPVRLVMIDFCTAWLGESAATRDEGDGISAAYSAPEFWNDGPVDFRADQFSATVVLYEMLTSERPFDGMGGKAGWIQFRESFRDGLALPSRLSPDRRRLPVAAWRGIDALVRKGLSFEPDGRFETPGAWLNAIESTFTLLKPNRPVSALTDVATRLLLKLADSFRRE